MGKLGCKVDGTLRWVRPEAGRQRQLRMEFEASKDAETMENYRRTVDGRDVQSDSHLQKESPG